MASTLPEWARRPLMQWLRFNFCVQPSRQHFTIMLLLVGFFVALVPIPVGLIRDVAQKDLSQPFPCQNRPCGCRNADQCRKKCCCFTPLQKMAWGKRHGIKGFEIPSTPTPPPKALCEVKWITIRKAPLCMAPIRMTPIHSAQTASQGCCSAKTELKLSSIKVNAEKPKRTDAVNQPADTAKSTPRFQTVIGVCAQQCQGVEQSLAGLPIFILPLPITLEILIEPRGERLTVEPVQFLSAAIQPPVPPPRAIAV